MSDSLDLAAIDARALVSLGDTTRLKLALARARRGERVTLGVIGGSITQGAKASVPELRWGERVAAWWRSTFPQAEVRFHNAGIGATGSLIAAHRVGALLALAPDVVVVEFAVNDPNDDDAAESLEGLVRQILASPKAPAVMLLYTMNSMGGNAQEQHGRVALRYGLPQVSFRDGLWPEVQASRLDWNQIEADEVHPNDEGHGWCARFVINAIAAVLERLPADSSLPAKPRRLPSPLISDTYQRAQLLNRERLTPLAVQGFREDLGAFGPCWMADEPGASITFEVDGTALSALFHRIKGDTGIATAQVDEWPPVDLVAWFDADWGGYSAYERLARDLPAGRHRLTITLTDRLPGSSAGHRFQLLGVLAAGR